ncbi:MAG: peptide deformylase, partial [Burkholderiaceae bacterium]
MALLSILRYPDPRLHTVAKPVTAFDQSLQKLVADLADTMYTAPGIGLAATQVDVHQQVIVIDVSDTRDQLLVLVNPEIVWASEERQVYDEGCLSVPGIFDGVERPVRVRVKAHDAAGKLHEFDAEG